MLRPKRSDGLTAHNITTALQHAIDQRLSRRNFMKLAGIAGLTVAAVPSQWGCGPASDPNFNPAPQERALIEQAIEAEAQAQAICMQTGDFERAYAAFVAKRRPVFEGN